mgnify:CR=1 FL=1
MVGFAGFAFAAPWALLGLLALPLIFWLARAIPPPPKEAIFPPAALLGAVKIDEETPQRSPVWLLILRAIAVATLVLGFASPVINPSTAEPDGRNLVIVIDDGWSSAPEWPAIIGEAKTVVETELLGSATVRLIFTAPDKPRANAEDALSPRQAVERLDAAEPKPWGTDRQKATALLAAIPTNSRVVWFSNGLAEPGDSVWLDAVSRLGTVEVRRPDGFAVALTKAEPTAAGYRAFIQKAVSEPFSLPLQVRDERGRVLGTASIALPPKAGAYSAEIAVPPALTKRATSVVLGRSDHAGAIRLLGTSDRRARIGLVAPPTDAQPLVSDAYFLQRALASQAETVRGDIASLTASDMDVIILPDARPQGAEADALRKWVREGGLLIRYAGPRFDSSGGNPTENPEALIDDLLPAPILPGVRRLDAGVAFTGALGIAAFPADGPFAGLTVPNDITVRAQVLIDPAANPAPLVWASLSDGTPLIAARGLGEGSIVLIATTAGPAWGDLALSGLQPALLGRLARLPAARSNSIGPLEGAPTTALAPKLLIDGFGSVRPAGSDDPALTPERARKIGREAIALAPGIYSTGQEARQLAIIQPNQKLTRIEAYPQNFKMASPGGASPIELGGAFIVLGLALLAIDMLVAIFLLGGRRTLSFLRFAKASAPTVFFAAMVGVGLFGMATNARAEAPMPLDLRLAFVETGDPATDSVALNGLRGLSRFVRERTAAEPGEPIGVDPSNDDLGAYPILFWVVPPSPSPPSTETIARLRRFLASGGMLFVDTRGNAAAGRLAVQGLALPPLVAVPEGHTLTKTFYLLKTMPGRRTDSRLFVETDASAADGDGDGASSILLGDGDWVSAWAIDGQGRPLFSVEGGERGRELAYRVGTNVVIYALTGTYKSDQVHVPALLDRLRR